AVVEDAGRDRSALPQRLSSMEETVVSDVLHNRDHGRITIFHLPDRPGSCSGVFQAVAAGGIVVDMIVQTLTGQGRGELSFSVPRSDLPRALALTQQTARALAPAPPPSPPPALAHPFLLVP